jgi:hypothetical protein
VPHSRKISRWHQLATTLAHNVSLVFPGGVVLGPERRALVKVSFSSGHLERAIVVMSCNEQALPLLACLGGCFLLSLDLVT